MSAENVTFDFSEEVTQIAINNKTEEEITIYKNIRLRISENVPKVVISMFSKMPKTLPVPIRNNKQNLNILKKSVDKDMSKRFHDQFESLVKEFSDNFFMSERDLGKRDVTTHQIDVNPGSKPVKIPSRRLPLHYKEDVPRKFDVLLEKELKTPYQSPYSAPLILLSKKEGKLRLVTDYRQLIKQTSNLT